MDMQPFKFPDEKGEETKEPEFELELEGADEGKRRHQTHGRELRNVRPPTQLHAPESRPPECYARRPRQWQRQRTDS